MTELVQKQPTKPLWNIAVKLREAMNAGDFRDHIPSFLSPRYLPDRSPEGD